MLFQQVAEVEDGGRVGDTVAAQLDPGNLAHGVAVIEAFLRHRIASRGPDLQKVDPQQHLQRHRRAAALGARLRVVRRDPLNQPRPRHHRVHLR